MSHALRTAGKNASAEFEEVAREVISLHAAIKELGEEANKPHSLLDKAPPAERDDLQQLVKNIHTVLLQLEKLLKKYSSLSSKHRRKWDIFRFGTEGVSEIRSRITFHTSAINLFLTSLGTESLSRIETKLDEIVLEFKRGDRDASTVAQLEEDVTEAEEQWKALKQELVDDGFTKQDIETHKDWIKGRLIALIAHEISAGVSLVSKADNHDDHVADQSLNETFNPLPLSTSLLDQHTLGQTGSARSYLDIHDDVAKFIEEPDPAGQKWICKFDDCNKRFGRKENIEAHLKTHLSIRQFHCDHCEKPFI